MEILQILLEWCQNLTIGYSGVKIENFTTSWKSGLAFAALIHRFKPELIDFHGLNPENEMYNNVLAFKLAEIHFGIPSLLDPKDMALNLCPERLSIITYVSQFYNCLKNMEPNGGPDINKFENTNNDNVEFDRFSSQTSVEKLREMKCSICFSKVFLLERYVAEDKLYHRQCYRDFQIKNIDNDSEVIGDYLNIYGELKPNMNKNIFVHPLQGMKLENDFKYINTEGFNDMKGYMQVVSEDSDQEKEYSESLSSFNSEESNKYCFGELQYTEEDVYHKTTDDYISNIQNETEENTNSQDNLVFNISKTSSLKPIKTRLYIKKKDMQLPYSTFFEIYTNVTYNICNDIRNEGSFEENDKIYDNLTATNISGIDHIKPHVVLRDERKLIEIKVDTESESDLLSVKEERVEELEPSIVRNSIWRKPIICSTYLRKCQSVSVPIETKYKCYSEFKDRLTNLNKKQSLVESKGREIQLRLWEEDTSSPDYERLLCSWLELVEDKDKLFYEENAIYSWLKDIKLQEMKENIECKIRLLYEGNTERENSKRIEEELIKKLIEIVNKRSELVDAIEKENLKRLETIKMNNEAKERLHLLKVKDSCVEPMKSKETTKKKISFWNRKSSHI